MAQVNSIVGDIEGNTTRIIEYIERAKSQGTDIIAFPELAITGYPPQDLLYERSFLEANRQALDNILPYSKDIVVIVGFVDFDSDHLFNTAAVMNDGKIVAYVNKTLLPTYDVFDEERYFECAKEKDIKPVLVEVNDTRLHLGVEICEDLWDKKYPIKVTDLLVERGADLIINISASPFHIKKRFERAELLTEKAKKNRVPIFYVNLVGGQDELVFSGLSTAIDSAGNVMAYCKQFESDLVVLDFDLESGTGPITELPPYHEESEMYNALVLGIRDYFRKTGFERAILGLSGGIDSSITACIAVDALGKDNVIGVSMPSKYSSDHSKSDAEKLAENLGIRFLKFSIQDIVDSYHRTLEAPLAQIRESYGISIQQDDPVADENIQPRARGNCLMDFSNRLRELKILVLNTGNKTELALGYCTLYGDMTGGVGVIGDVSKLEVYKLSHYVNERESREVIPEGSLKKKPSAELKFDQYDPFDFDIVSPMVDEIVENRRGKQELIDLGYPKDVVEDVYRRVRQSEYKRWQAPPCIRVTRRSFGMGWKMPIVNWYRE
ncbi:MAG: NAD+ synthase [Candidatus Lokiarchaeota archaeon]|nr:NAD+ synthase [Candidatus Lokiarchaeota archaeon]